MRFITPVILHRVSISKTLCLNRPCPRRATISASRSVSGILVSDSIFDSMWCSPMRSTLIRRLNPFGSSNPARRIGPLRTRSRLPSGSRQGSTVDGLSELPQADEAIFTRGLFSLVTSAKREQMIYGIGDPSAASGPELDCRTLPYLDCRAGCKLRTSCTWVFRQLQRPLGCRCPLLALEQLLPRQAIQ